MLVNLPQLLHSLMQ